MTMAATALALLLAQGQPLPPGHPAVSGGTAPAAGQTSSGDSALPPGHPAIGTGAPSSDAPGASGAQPAPEGLPAGHPNVAPGAAPPTSDELIRRMDSTPDLKTRAKPYEVSAAIGKLYYGRARWADARDFFLQAETAAAPLRSVFLEQRRLVKGELPAPSASGCRLASDMAVDKVAEKARTFAAQKQPGPAATCAREALGPVLDSTALLGNTLALIGDGRGALAAYERVLQVDPRNASALYGHGAVTFDVKGDDVAALRAARKELQTSAELTPGTSQASSARALAERIDKVIAAGGAAKFARQQEKTRAEARPAVAAAAAPAMPPMAAAEGSASPPQLSKETIEAFQKTEVTPIP